VGLFLALVFAVLVVMLVWSRRAEIRDALREHRKESRIPTDILLELSNVGGTFVETVPAENISRHGARLLTPTRWPPHDRVFIGLPQAVEHSRRLCLHDGCVCELRKGIEGTVVEAGVAENRPSGSIIVSARPTTCRSDVTRPLSIFHSA